MIKTYIIDKDHLDKFDPEYFETTKWHDIGDGIEWRPYKHWFSGVLAAQGCINRNGDRSGCLDMFNGQCYVRLPGVVEARMYRKGEKEVSAVFSYPQGLSAIDSYFWEIYDYVTDVERFFGENAEEEMEQRIKEILS